MVRDNLVGSAVGLGVGRIFHLVVAVDFVNGEAAQCDGDNHHPPKIVVDKFFHVFLLFLVCISRLAGIATHRPPKKTSSTLGFGAAKVQRHFPSDVGKCRLMRVFACFCRKMRVFAGKKKSILYISLLALHSFIYGWSLEIYSLSSVVYHSLSPKWSTINFTCLIL